MIADTFFHCVPQVKAAVSNYAGETGRAVDDEDFYDVNAIAETMKTTWPSFRSYAKHLKAHPQYGLKKQSSEWPPTVSAHLSLLRVNSDSIVAYQSATVWSATSVLWSHVVVLLTAFSTAFAVTENIVLLLLALMLRRGDKHLHNTISSSSKASISSKASTTPHQLCTSWHCSTRSSCCWCD